MERSEPTLVPEWLKGSGSVTSGGSSSHLPALSSLHADNRAVIKPTRGKSSVGSSGHDIGRSFSDRTTSSYFRQSSSSNSSSHLRSYSSFGRSHRDKDWEDDIHEYHEKDKSILGDYRHIDYSDPLGSILPSRFEKDVLRRSQSMNSGKQGKVWPKKVAADPINANKNNYSNGNALITGGGAGSIHKAAFERDFPSLASEERQGASEMGRVPSPGLSTATQNLPVGNSAMIGANGWTSALAEAPMTVGNSSTVFSSAQNVSASSASIASSTATSLNMAETLVQGSSHSRTTPQVSVGSQRLEELAFKQSKQLIPMMPVIPKSLVLNPTEKPKFKIGQLQQHQTSSQLVNCAPRSMLAKSDSHKTSSVGKLHVLKPARERNGVLLTAKESLSPTNSGKVGNSPLTVAPLAAGSAPLSPGSNPNHVSAGRKPAINLASVEKRPTSQAQSRNDFFNLMRKKYSMNASSAAPDTGPVVSSAVLKKSDEFNREVAVAPVIQDGHASLLATLGGDGSTKESADMINKGDTGDGSPKFLDIGEELSGPDVICYPEEEEAAFLRSLGWEENGGEDEGLTEEEISAFLKEHVLLRPSSKLLKCVKPKTLMALSSQESSSGGVSSGSSPSDSETES